MKCRVLQFLALTLAVILVSGCASSAKYDAYRMEMEERSFIQTYADTWQDWFADLSDVASVELSAGEGRGERPRCRRQRLSAANMPSLTAIWRILLPFPTVVNHQFPSASREKSRMAGVQRVLAANSEMRKYIAYSADNTNNVRSCVSASSAAKSRAVRMT